MPEAFEKCRRNGGRIRTVTGPSKRFNLGTGEYKHICFLNGEVYEGERKTKKNSKK